MPNNLLQERIIPHSIPEKQFRHTSESDTFKSKETRTILNNTVLDNGFLLVERITQNWDGSNWSNEVRNTYIYDTNNNLIEEVLQFTDASSNWVNYEKYIYTYIPKPTGVEQFEGEVYTYSLSQNFPNPFNPVTIIKFQVRELSFVTLKVYDVLGKEITALVNEEKHIGNYEVEFDATKLPSGIYFYHIKAGSFVETKKMVLMK